VLIVNKYNNTNEIKKKLYIYINTINIESLKYVYILQNRSLKLNNFFFYKINNNNNNRYNKRKSNRSRWKS